MWLMLQQDEPDDFVIATGETHSIEELVERAFAEVGIENWRDYVRQDPKFFRPAEVDLLDRRRVQGPRPARLAAGGRLPVAGRHDGAQRPRRSRPRRQASRYSGGVSSRTACR